MVEPKQNLLIVHTPGAQDIGDWTKVQKLIAERAPDIEVQITNNEEPGHSAKKWQVTRPSLVFSPLAFRTFRPAGGTVYVGVKLGKLEQARRMTEAGLSTPRTLPFIPGILLKPEIWGEYVIVKPDRGVHGIGVSIVRTDEVGAKFGALMSRNALRNEMIVQQFIDHADAAGVPTDYRALMMFGKPLYLHRRRWQKQRRSIEDLARDLSGDIAANVMGNARGREPDNDPEVLEIAARAASVFKEIPVLGVDIARDRSGKLYVFETNSGGGIWHLSSDLAKSTFSPALRKATYRQFNALETVADLLIERTRAEAR